MDEINQLIESFDDWWIYLFAFFWAAVSIFYQKNND
jgi:hypothetical protein